MKLWLLLFAAFIVQEPISSNAALLAAYQDHYDVWLIHGVFVGATVFDIVAGYYLGVYASKKYSHLRLVSYLKGKLDRFSRFIGAHGKTVALVFYAPIIFPISVFFVPWLGISFLDALVFIFLGELVFWYAYEWLLVLGVHSLFSNPAFALCAVVLTSIVTSLVIKYLSRKRS